MNILFLGNDDAHCSARQRALALERLGHRVRQVNPQRALSSSRLLGKIHYLTGYALAVGGIARFVLTKIRGEQFDLGWVDGGANVSCELVTALKEQCGRVVNYNLDDPTGRRDGNFWRTFKRALPAYDLTVVVRHESFREYRQLGARNVLQVFRGYDELAHAPVPSSAADAAKWGAPVVFAGTWMPERGGFLAQLLRSGIPLAIHGNRWEKAPEWSVLKSVWRGPAVVGADYVKAIQYARVSLGLLSRGNRDLHTQRSAEIPFIGGLLCAEHTPEHTEMYRDGVEAVFWRDAVECAEKCRWLLDNPATSRAIAAAGQRRAGALGLANQTALNRILRHLEGNGQNHSLMNSRT